MNTSPAGRRIALIRRFIRTKPMLPALAVFLLAFIVRAENITYRSIWMDEDAQARVAEGPLSSMISRTAHHHQPPIDYCFEKLMLSVFGNTEIGARIHAVIWSALATALFFLLLIRTMRHPVAVAAGTLLFLLHPDLIRYAQEGRPISAGVFFATVYLFIWSTHPPAARVGGCAPKRLITVALSAAGLMLSVGFQPIVLIAALLLARLPALASRTNRKGTLCFIGGTVLGVLATMPIIRLGITEGRAYLGTASFGERLSSIWTALLSFDPGSYHQKLAPFFGDHLALLVAALPLAAYAWKKHAAFGKKIQCRRISVELLLTLMLYPIVFDTLFNALISYRIMLRYYLSLAPVALFLTSRLMDDALLGLGALSRGTSRRAVATAGGVLLIAFVLSLNHAVDGIRDRNKTSIRTDWRSLYGLINTSVQKGSHAYLFSLVPVDRWSPPLYYAQRFYYKKNASRPVRLNHRRRLLLHYQHAKRYWKEDVLIVTPYGFSSIHASLLKDLRHVAVHRFTRLSVIHIAAHPQIKDTVRAVFERLASRLSKTENHYRIFETLGQLRLADGDRDGAIEMVEVLRAMDDRGELFGRVITPLGTQISKRR